MPSVFEKLNHRGQSPILVVGAPASFEPELAGLAGIEIVRQVDRLDPIGFALAFVTRQAELDALAAAIVAQAPGDPILWFAYPKGSSKRYRCEFHRDNGWAALGAAGFEGVRLVAIDEDWSALRFRRVEFIKTLKRDPKRAASAEGRRRTSPGPD